MMNPFLLQHLIAGSAERHPDRPALVFGDDTLSYSALARDVEAFASGVVQMGLARGERVGIYLDKRFETVIASFGAAAAGGVFVPVNPLLKPEQVAYILRDCNVRVLVTSRRAPRRCSRRRCAECPDLRHVIVIGPTPNAGAGRSRDRDARLARTDARRRRRAAAIA